MTKGQKSCLLPGWCPRSRNQMLSAKTLGPVQTEHGMPLPHHAESTWCLVFSYISDALLCLNWLYPSSCPPPALREPRRNVLQEHVNTGSCALADAVPRTWMNSRRGDDWIGFLVGVSHVIFLLGRILLRLVACLEGVTRVSRDPAGTRRLEWNIFWNKSCSLSERILKWTFKMTR